MNDFDSSGTPDIEFERVRKLREQLDLNLDNYLRDGYQAVALHASSIIITANEAGAEMFGYTVEEIEGMNAWTLFTPNSFDTLLQNLSSKSTRPYVVEGRRKDGSVFKVELLGKDFSVAGQNVRSVLLRRVP